MDVVTRAFESEALRQADRGLFGQWLFTERIQQHRELLQEMPIQCANCVDTTKVLAADAAPPIAMELDAAADAAVVALLEMVPVATTEGALSGRLAGHLVVHG